MKRVGFMINESIDTAFIDRVDRLIQSYKRMVVETEKQEKQIAGLLEQCKQWKKKNDELKKEINKAHSDIDKFEDYTRSTLQSFFDAHINEKDEYLLRKLEESFMQMLRSNYQETPDLDITVNIGR